MSQTSDVYDIFISYAHEEREWVWEHVYQPLLRCRSRMEGRRPRVFIDDSEDGLVSNRNIQPALANALTNSRKIILVYSDIYFQKDYCRWEMGLALDRDLLGDRGIVHPVHKEPNVPVPVHMKLISFTRTDSPNWFSYLCNALGLKPEAQPACLKFLEQPVGTMVNHTLCPVSVALASPDGNVVAEDDEITISCDGSTLQGTTTIRTSGGIALFSDLSIEEASASVRLVASAKGRDNVLSDAFKVTNTPRRKSPARGEKVAETRKPEACIKSKGVVTFFADGGALAVTSGNCTTLYGRDCEPVGPAGGATLPGRRKFFRRAGRFLVTADWSGGVQVFAEDGVSVSRSFADKAGGFAVIGDIAAADDAVYVSLWNGCVFRLLLDGTDPDLVARHEGGVQALAVIDGRIYVCDFEGSLCAYKDGHCVNACRLETCIHLLKQYPEFLVVVGDKKLYQIKPAGLEVLSEGMSVTQVAEVLGDVDIPVVMDARGKGFRMDSDLALKETFYTTAGAVPESADNDGRYCVFRNPDGSRTLLTEGRIVYTHISGAFAVAPGGDLFALGDKDEIRLVSAGDFEARIKEVPS